MFEEREYPVDGAGRDGGCAAGKGEEREAQNLLKRADLQRELGEMGKCSRPRKRSASRHRRTRRGWRAAVSVGVCRGDGDDAET